MSDAEREREIAERAMRHLAGLLHIANGDGNDFTEAIRDPIREHVVVLRRCHDALRSELTAARAEAERLRAALREIVEADEGVECDYVEMADAAAADKRRDAAFDAARALLAGQAEGEGGERG